MPNILDYINWRGDLSFKQDKFNNVDNLILSRFAYFPLDAVFENIDKVKDKNGRITIRNAYIYLMKNGIPEEKILQKEDKDLFPVLANSERFGNLVIDMYANRISKKEEKQFSAVSIFIPDGTVYVSYRGTDNTLVGWKEDFNMSLDINIPSQKEAVRYLNEIYEKTHKNIRVGGHSKGGNLAMYAAIFCNKKVKNNILEVYNNDGPGLNMEIVNSIQYKQILSKIKSFIPQTSIIGKLMYHEEKYKIIKSTQKGIMQHDLYTWQVEGKEFIYLKEVTNESEAIDAIIKEWTTKFTPKQRSEFINIIYDLVNETNSETLYEMSKNRFKTMGTIIKAYHKTNKKNKQIISQTFLELFGITKNNVYKNINDKLNKKDKKMK